MSAEGLPSVAIRRLLSAVVLVTSQFLCVTPQPILAQSRQTATVNVRVTEYDQEEPIFQADVRLYTFGHGVYTHRAFTDGAGRVTFPTVGRGNYYLEVEKMGYETSRENIDVRPGAYEFYGVRLHRSPDAPAAVAPTDKVSATALGVPNAARKEYELGVSKLMKDPGASIPHFRRAIQQYAQYAEAYAMLGVAQMRAKQGDEAMKSLTRAIELNPKLRLARTSMGELLLERKEYARAESELLESSRLDPQAWDTAFHLARCYFNMGKLDQALEYARRAESLPGAPSTTHLLLVDIYLRRNDQQAALHELEDFAKADPNSPLMPRVQQKIAQLRKQNPN